MTLIAHGLSTGALFIVARALEIYRNDAICVTLGSKGCYVHQQSESFMVPGYQVSVCDTVGARDAFSAAFPHGYRAGWPLLTTAKFANAVGCIVAGRPLLSGKSRNALRS